MPQNHISPAPFSTALIVSIMEKMKMVWKSSSFLKIPNSVLSVVFM